MGNYVYFNLVSARFLAGSNTIYDGLEHNFFSQLLKAVLTQIFGKLKESTKNV